MQEFEPKLKKKIFTREFFSKYIYIFVIGLCLLLGISYGLTFFTENKNIASGRITTGDLSITVSDRSIAASGLTVPSTDQDGLALYSKIITLENTTNIDGSVRLYLSRTSGLNLSDLKCAVLVNGAIQKIIDVPTNGEILTTAILAGSQPTSVEIRLWPKTTYEGDKTTFNGEIGADVRYLGQTATSLSNPVGKYVSFNCDNNSCEIWQIVKIEDGRLVLTRQNDYAGATERTNLGKYNSELSFNDDSLITSVSTDGKNVYLAKTVKVNGGNGTELDPYILINDDYDERDQKVICTITYKNADNSNFSTQKIYYGQTNYISQMIDNRVFVHWKDSNNNTYDFGSVVNFTSDIILTAVNASVSATQIEFDKTATISAFNCDTTQCAIDSLVTMIGPIPDPICIRATVLHTETCSQTSNYCAADGYTGANTTITYGNTTTTNRKLTTGDAFDCNVDGTGYNERFYYVSDRWIPGEDTDNFDNQTAVLIYYKNFKDGAPSDLGVAYDSNSRNYNGPVTAVTHLPTTSTWSNISLSSTSRMIYACDNGNCSNTPSLYTTNGINEITPNPYSYTGKAARLLTVPELKKGCTSISNKTTVDGTGDLTECNFIFERTQYANTDTTTYPTYGPWLETPRASFSNVVWNASAHYRYVNSSSVSDAIIGARPAIEVPKGRISY